MIRGILTVLAIVVLLTSASCLFKQTELVGVMSYRNGKVFLKKDNFYSVGKLPSGWHRMKTRAKAISFYNPGLRSSITTDAFCGAKVENSALGALGGDMISALDQRKVTSEQDIQLDGRQATRRFVTGTLDGVDVLVDYVVVRKDGCIFDFYAVISDVAEKDEVSAVFEDFYKGFEYNR